MAEVVLVFGILQKGVFILSLCIQVLPPNTNLHTTKHQRNLLYSELFFIHFVNRDLIFFISEKERERVIVRKKEKFNQFHL